jgi:hypothetical protein
MKKNNDLDFSKIEKRQQMAKILSGVFVIIFGVFVLLHQLDIEIPKIFRSWELIIIMIGIVILVKHNFKNFGGYALIIIGSVLMLNDFYPDLISMKIIWPSIIILFGVSILLKAFSSKKSNFVAVDNDTHVKSDSFFETSTYFGSVLKKVDAKNFKGAAVTSVFGGVEIDLTDCEVEDLAVIDIMAVFSGVTLVIPPDWEVKSELSSILGGIEDKRTKNTSISTEQTKKRVLLRGTCVFSGVDITNFAKRR